MTITRHLSRQNKGAAKTMGAEVIQDKTTGIVISAIGVGLAIGLFNGAVVNLNGCRSSQDEYRAHFRTPCPAQSLTCDEFAEFEVTSEGEPLELLVESEDNCAPIKVHVFFNGFPLDTTEFIWDNPAAVGYLRRTRPLTAKPTSNGLQNLRLQGEAGQEGCAAAGNLPEWGGVALIRKIGR
jgi:hypothetical protein